ncbi:MAG: hypothetical protein WBE82_13740, partial [Xanthobacteraceae bacterium]
ASALPAYSRICSMSRPGSAGCGRAAGGGPKTIPKKPPLRNRGLLPADSQVQKPEFTSAQREIAGIVPRGGALKCIHIFLFFTILRRAAKMISSL